MHKCGTKNAPPPETDLLVCMNWFLRLPKNGRHKRIIVTRLFSRRSSCWWWWNVISEFSLKTTAFYSLDFKHPIKLPWISSIAHKSNRVWQNVCACTKHVYANMLRQLKGTILIVGMKRQNQVREREKGQANKKSDSRVRITNTQ